MVVTSCEVVGTEAGDTVVDMSRQELRRQKPQRRIVSLNHQCFATLVGSPHCVTAALETRQQV